MRTLISVLFVAALVAASPVLQAQETEKDKRINKRISRYIKWLDKKQGPDFWNTILKLEVLGEDAAPLIQKRLAESELSDKVKLGLGKVLITLDEEDAGLDLLYRLLAGSKDKQVRIMAAGLLGSLGAASLETKLLKVLDGTFDAYLRIAVAKALYNATGAVRGVHELKALLKSDSVKVQYEAALALAELDNIEAARMVLLKLEKEPTPRGRLARALLKQEELAKRMGRLLMGGAPKKAPAAREESELLEELIRTIQKYHVDGHRFTREKLLSLGAKGMASKIDRHSTYWTEKEWNDFIKQITGDYAGIGVYVGLRGGYFTVISPIYSGPAYKAGLRSRDRILEVEGWSTINQPMDEIIKRIQGEPGTPVKLKIYREGWEKARPVSVVRAKIQVKSVKSVLMPGKLGYARLTQFGSKTAEELSKAIQQMKVAGMKGLILDLRDNGGGYMMTAQKVADLFLTQGKLVVYSQGRNKEIAPRRDLLASDKTIYPDGPLYVMINGSSASASEIVAGALQVHKRAILVGERSFGKGTVQQPLLLESRKNARLKLTIARYYLPNDKSIDSLYDADDKLIHKGGIAPDVKAEPARLASWKNEEYTRIREKNGLKGYLKKHYETHKALFRKLAVNDRRDYTRYPDFEAWYKSLGTKATRQDVRSWIRGEIREKVADLRGREFVHDLLEDRQLQKTVLLLCKKTGVDPSQIGQFKSFIDNFKPAKKEGKSK